MKVVVCVSGGGTNLQSLIDARRDGRLPEAELALVIASRPGIKALERAAAAGIPTRVIRRADFADQSTYDEAMIAAVEQAGAAAGLIVLAGFLTRLGVDFIGRFSGRIMNIHPSLLPAFGGAGYYGIRPHEAVLEYGCKLTGATVHLVDEGYDSGPIVAQRALEVRADDNAESLQARVMREIEHRLLPLCVDWFTRGRLHVEGRLVRLDEGGQRSRGIRTVAGTADWKY